MWRREERGKAGGSRFPMYVYYCRTYEKAVSGGGRGKKEDMC